MVNKHMKSIISHYRNANRNHSEMPFHIFQKRVDEENLKASYTADGNVKWHSYSLAIPQTGSTQHFTPRYMLKRIENMTQNIVHECS